MNWIYFLLSWSPVLLLSVLAVGFRQSALALSAYGLAFSGVLAAAGYGTPLSVIVLAAVDGVLTTLPLLLVILAGILLSGLLVHTGALARMVAWFTPAGGRPLVRNLLITFGIGNFMEGTGVIAEPVIAPMLATAGVPPAGAAALSIIGYAGLMTLEMAGIIITVLALVTGLPVYELGLATAWLSIPATIVMALCAGGYLAADAPGATWRLWAALAGCGAILGFTALAAVIVVGIPVSGMLAGLTVILVLMAAGRHRPALSLSVAKDFLPFGGLIAWLLAVNAVPALHRLAFKEATLRFAVVPVHDIVYRPLFSAYLYLFAAFVLTAVLQRVSRADLAAVLRDGIGRGWRAFVAMGLFGAMGQILSMSGYAEGFATLDTARHIPWVMSNGLSHITGGAYPLCVPVLGWVGTFLTGYGVASLMLFGQLQVQAAADLGVSPVWLAAGLAVGASLGSVSSPFKIALATVMSRAVGREGRILRRTIPMGIGACVVIGIVLMMAA